MDDGLVIGNEPLSPDAAAIVLLCTSLGTDRDETRERPLGPVAYAALQEAIARSTLTGPGDLVGLEVDDIAGVLGLPSGDAAAHARRLARHGQLAFEVDRLLARGVWVVTVIDDPYPARLRDRLGKAAPPVLFGSGPISMLATGGVAIVGSRDADEAANAFTERLAASVAAGGATVVSGGARGVDVAAMRAAFDAGGTVIGVLPVGVERRLKEASTRSAVANGQAVLVSPYHPAAVFSAGAAMGRNKLIYALADVAVVVSSAEGSGGTWTGAIEAMKGAWAPVLVRDEPGVPPGNLALIAQGASPLRGSDLAESIAVHELVESARADRGGMVAERLSPYRQETLFDTD
jgi:predicted Rossmann fold nucleotide-binding protein DprA/Smf involved in DNA uptake